MPRSYLLPVESRQLKVLYDGMIFHRQETGGINRYFEKLIDHLPTNVDPAITLSKCPSNNFCLLYTSPSPRD